MQPNDSYFVMFLDGNMEIRVFLSLLVARPLHSTYVGIEVNKNFEMNIV